jgi:hypothetical protein
MSKPPVDRPFETEPADADGNAVLKPVAFKGAHSTAMAISLRTNSLASNDTRQAELKIKVSKAPFDDLLKHASDLSGPGGPFNAENFDDINVACAEFTYWDGNPCLPPLPPTNCNNPQVPFLLTDCDSNPACLPPGSAFWVTGTLKNYPQNAIVTGLMLLFFR